MSTGPGDRRHLTVLGPVRLMGVRICPFHDGDDCDCQAWMDYWDSLSPEQQRAEITMMDQHANYPEGA